MSTSHYPLIIIGAGITGLSTALAWKKVFPGTRNDLLILERNATVGGCVTTFARKGFRFDTTQIISDVSDLLEFFKLEIPLIKFEGYYARLFMADPKSHTVQIFSVPCTVEDFEKTLSDSFPEDAMSIKKFFRYCVAMYHELNYLKTEPRCYQLPGILVHCPRIIANSGKTYRQFLQKFRFKNQDVYQILDIFSSFSGLSADRCAALLTACAMITTLKGSCRPQKGFI